MMLTLRRRGVRSIVTSASAVSHGFREVTKAFGDHADVVETPGSDVDHEFISFVIAADEMSPVEGEEQPERTERRPLVAVDQRAILGQGMDECGCLHQDPRVDILPEDHRLRPSQGRFQQTPVLLARRADRRSGRLKPLRSEIPQCGVSALEP
ncbi:hypothetical protein [Dermacoccus nishinomiyaensis]|uniref:hypothetical protein n=1 Tax=Dermacoccus nishinomiyaensis TaxID=1274 RepID=UPI003F4A837D